MNGPLLRHPGRWLGGLALAAALLAPAAAVAAEPVTLPLQGALRTAGGGPVPDGNYVLVVALYDAADATKPAWKELENKVAVQGGTFALTLGLVEPIPAALMTSGQPLWLGVQPGGEEELPRVALAWTARAWHAAVAAAGAFPYAAAASPGGPATGLQCSGCVTGTMVAPGTLQASHLGFAFAGAQTKGGPADDALHATNADTAKSADYAAKSGLATSADDLQCTGCVTVKHLAADVAAAFVPAQGGTVTGKLAVQGGLDLQDSTLQGANLPFVTVADAPCGAKQAGRLVVDAASKALHLCTGAGWQKLKGCSGKCQSAALVPCGEAVTDDCGDAGGCQGQGNLCDAGGVCTGGKCVLLGGAASNGAASCKAILAAGAAQGDGLYWLDADGPAGPVPAFQAYCDMTTAGGGWTLLLTLTHPADTFAGSVHPLIQELNAASPSPTTAYGRDWRKVFTPQKGSEFLIKRGGTGQWARFVVEAWCGWDSTATAPCTGPHGTYAQGCAWDQAGKLVSCTDTWLNSCSNAGGCLSNGCDTLGINVGHGDYAAQYGGGMKLYGSGWNGSTCHPAWDQAIPVADVLPQTAWYR